MLKKLTLKQCANLDGGKVAAAFALHSKKIVQDCMDRPGSDAVRKITMEFLVTPSLDPDTGECDDVNVEVEIGSKVPKHRSRPINCQVRKSAGGAQLIFNDMNEKNVNQRTLDQQSPSFTKEAVGIAANVDPDDDDEDDEDSELDDE